VQRIGHYAGVRHRPRVRRERVSYRESVELAMDYWEGGSLVLTGLTSLWYCMRGAPVARRERAAAERGKSGTPTMWLVIVYTVGVVSLVFTVGVLVGLVVFIV
jgi:hypothetical protein